MLSVKNSEKFKDDFASNYYENLRDYYELKTVFLQSNSQFKKRDELLKCLNI
ncbi:MAG: hypothetical protein R3A12_10755 [Ignavibacteria bacterium]